MKLLEVIELRTAAGNVDMVEQYLQSWIGECRHAARVVRSYRHASLETDFSVHLTRERGSTATGPSVEGRQLAGLLKDFGLVNHSVWVEQNVGEYSAREGA